MAIAAVWIAAVGPAFAAPPADRSYEQVSPVQKAGSDAALAGASGPDGTVFASRSGNGMVYNSFGSFAGAPSGVINQYLALRTATGWVNRPLTPSLEGEPTFPDFLIGFRRFACFDCPTVVGTLLRSPDPADTNMQPDVYASSGEGSWTWISQGSLPNATGGDLRGHSDDGSLIAFDSTSVLEPAAAATTGGNMVSYVRTNGQTEVVSVDSDENLITPGGSRIGGFIGGTSHYEGAVSADGSRVFFEAPIDSSDVKHLYVREDGATTRRMDVAQCTGSGCAMEGDAHFQGASRDGSEVRFSTNAQLVDADTDAVVDLYEHDLVEGVVRRIATDFVALSRASVDGETLYVRSHDALTATPNGRGVTAQPAQDNLFAIRPDAPDPFAQVTFVGGSSAIAIDVMGVSPNGRLAVFRTSDDLGTPTGGTTQVYLYDSTADEAVCVSCGDGIPAVSTDNPGDFPKGPTDAGEIVFDTPIAIDPTDDNGISDVYLWEDGAAHLITSGHSHNYSIPIGISEDGRDVFFATSDRLLPSDNDDNQDVYDARRGGGFPQDAGPPECSGDGCQDPPYGSPALPALGTPGFAGSGNARPRARAARPTLRLLTRTVRRGRIAARVAIPSAGRVALVGPAVRSARRSLGKAGAHRIDLRLKPRALAKLRRTHRLVLRIRLSYRSRTGASSSARLAVTVKSR